MANSLQILICARHCIRHWVWAGNQSLLPGVHNLLRSFCPPTEVEECPGRSEAKKTGWGAVEKVEGQFREKHLLRRRLHSVCEELDKVLEACSVKKDRWARGGKR